MKEFENSPEILALKDVLREFFLGILENLKGAFYGFAQWLSNTKLNMPAISKLFSNTRVNGIILVLFIVLVLFLNIKAYILFAADKRYARSEEEERVPEWRLLFNIWFGGAIGAMAAMYRLRHKTKHKIFKVSVWFFSFIELLIFSTVIGFLSFWTFF